MVGGAVFIHLIAGDMVTDGGRFIGIIEDMVDGLTRTGGFARGAAVRGIARGLLAGSRDLGLGQARRLGGAVSIRVAVEIEITDKDNGDISVLGLDVGADIEHLTDIVNTPFIDQRRALARGHVLKALIIGADDGTVDVDNGEFLASFMTCLISSFDETI